MGAYSGLATGVEGLSLEKRTKLCQAQVKPWMVRVYPQLGEAVVTWSPGRVLSEGEKARRMVKAERTKSDEPTEESLQRGDRRARTGIRRYVVANWLRYMWTLTYRGEGNFSARRCYRDLAEMRRRLERAGTPVGPWLAVLEPHPGGHGWHVHLMVGRRLPHAQVAAAWGLGFAWVEDWMRRAHVGSARARLRAAAGYAAKYATKGLEQVKDAGCERERGTHRYDRSQGHAAQVDESRTDRMERALLELWERWPDARVVSESKDWQDYRGPPVAFVCWDERYEPR